MKKQKMRIAVALALAVTGVVGCAEPVGEQAPGDGVSQSEKVGETAQTVNNGTVDIDSLYPFAAHLSIGNMTCSGVLITPHWILSASHCFANEGASTSDVAVRIGLNTNSGGVYTAFEHTFAKSGPVFRYVDTTASGIDYIDSSIISRDIALFRLDKRVPASVTRPLHPSFSRGCGDDFRGVVVGYGGEKFSSEHEGIRTFKSSPDWERVATSTNDLLYNSWTLAAFNPLSDYDGIVEGDSGGPMIRNGVLCGVASSYFYGPMTPLFVEWEAKFAAFDTPEAEAWMNGIELPSGLPVAPAGLGLIDPKGNWDGECDEYSNCIKTGGGAWCENDTDEDGIIDLCDNCRYVYNPEQQVSDDDPDGDGLGAACDFCPTTRNTATSTNQNYEAELAVAYPGEAKPPLPITENTSDREAAITTYKTAFKPDVCDDILSPMQHDFFGGALAGLPAIVPCTVANTPNCNCQFGHQCEWNVTNKMRVSPYIHESRLHSSNDQATVGFRYCNCSDGYGIKERIACQASRNCQVANAPSYDDISSGWIPIVHEGSGGPGTQTALGAEFTASLVTSVLEQDAPLLKNWIFTATGIPVQQGYDSNGYVISKTVTGVIWAATRRLNGTLLSVPVRDYSNTYKYVIPRAKLSSQGPSVPQIEDHSWKYFCRDCPLGVSNIFAEIGNPGLHRMTKNGLQPLPGLVSTELRTLFSDLANGDKIFVPAAESMASRANASSSIPLGLVMSIIDLGNFTLGLVESRLESSSENSVPTVVPSATAFADINGTEGLSYLSMTDQLFAMGGDMGPGVAVVPKNSVSVFSQSSSNTVTFELDPGKMTYVLASTYRVEDNSFYIVDRDIQNVVTVKRWTPGEQPVTLLTTSPEILNYRKFYLVASDDGVGFVLVITDNAVDGDSYIYHLGVDSSGDIVLLGYAQVMEEVIAEPYFAPGGLALSLRNPNYGLRTGVWDLTTPSMMRSAQSSEPTEKPVFLAAPDLFSVQ